MSKKKNERGGKGGGGFAQQVVIATAATVAEKKIEEFLERFPMFQQPTGNHLQPQNPPETNQATQKNEAINYKQLFYTIVVVIIVSIFFSVISYFFFGTQGNKANGEGSKLAHKPDTTENRKPQSPSDANEGKIKGGGSYSTSSNGKEKPEGRERDKETESKATMPNFSITIPITIPQQLQPVYPPKEDKPEPAPPTKDKEEPTKPETPKKEKPENNTTVSNSHSSPSYEEKGLRETAEAYITKKVLSATSKTKKDSIESKRKRFITIVLERNKKGILNSVDVNFSFDEIASDINLLK